MTVKEVEQDYTKTNTMQQLSVKCGKTKSSVVARYFTMWRIRMLVLFMYLRQNSHRYSLGSLQDDKQTVHVTIHNQENKTA